MKGSLVQLVSKGPAIALLGFGAWYFGCSGVFLIGYLLGFIAGVFGTAVVALHIFCGKEG
jgi:hypothetical protein